VGREHDLKLVKEEALPLLFTDDFMKKNPDYIENKINMMLKTPTTPSAYKRQIDAGMKSPTRCRKLKKIDIQTLVIHGKKDILVPPQNGEILTNLIPNAELELFDNNAHFVFQPEPEKVIETILAFLK
ncbi:MAG: alpha/beta fold hydrolase, partial [Promethearchaeota archaeon]